MARLFPNTPEAGLTSRERLWAAMRELRSFTVWDLCLKTGMPRSRARDYLTGLERAGILSAVHGKKSHSLTPEERQRENCDNVYRLEKDLGVNAPRVRKDGSFVPDSGRTRMWRAMPVLGEFSVRALAGVASIEGAPVDVEDAEFYCRWLHMGGYLQRLGVSVYRFIPARNTGPKAPQILRVKQLYDPNTDTVAATGEAKGRDDE